MKYLRIDSQILTSVSHCPLRARFRFIDRLKKKDEPNHFAMGSGIHVGMEVYYKGIKQGLLFKERYDSALIAANAWMTTESNLAQEDIDTVLRTLDEYFKFRKEDRILVREVEVPFSIEIYSGQDLKGEDITIIYEGKIDLIAELDENYVVDHKSSSRNFQPVEMTVQFLGYHWATQFPILINRVGFQSSLKPQDKFKRFPFRFEKPLVENWKNFAIHKALEYAYYLEEDSFPQNFSACDGKFGFPCDYVNLCRYPSLFDETKQFEFLVGEVWDPVKEKNT